jgi:hypothetical protein
MTEALEAVGVSIPPKTKRNRLLALLDQHVTRKKQKRSCQKSATPLTQSSPAVPLATTDPNPLIDNATVQQVHTEEQADYRQFDNSFLATLLRDVGVDCNGMERESLIENCRMYDELSKCTTFSNLFFVQIKFLIHSFWLSSNSSSSPNQRH